MAIQQTAGREALGDFAPKFAQLNDDVLFGEVWNRTSQLSLRDRSLVTVTALLAQGLTDSSFRYHLESAKKNGITKTEIAEILTHAASMVFPIGQPNDAYARYFIGQSYLAPLCAEQAGVYNVTFEPGCRNNWHIHHAKTGGGQILICISGRGFYQEWGERAQALFPGDVINIPAGVKHWHGAAPHSWFSHLAIEVPGEETANEWLEPVDEAAYTHAVC